MQTFSDFLQEKDVKKPDPASLVPAGSTPKPVTAPKIDPTPQQAQPAKPVSTGTKQPQSFSDFVKAKQPQQPQSFSNFLEGKQLQDKMNIPLKPWKNLSGWEKTKFVAAHPGFDLNVIQGALGAMHDAAMDLSGKHLGNVGKAGGEIQNDMLKPHLDVMANPKSTPEQRDDAMKAIQEINSPEMQKRLQGATTSSAVVRAALTTGVDWEAMGTVFKPLGLVGKLAGDTAKARAAVYAVNQALGAKFSYDQVRSGMDHWSKGEFGQAVTDFGGALAMAVMPVLEAAHREKEVTDASKEKLKRDAIRQLEILKTKQEGVENPPFSNDEIARAQDALRTPNPLETMAQQGPAGERTALRTREGILGDKLRQADLESERQRHIARQEFEYQAQAHDLRMKAEQSKTEADRQKFTADLEEREQRHRDHLQAEKERFPRGTPEPTPEEPASQGNRHGVADQHQDAMDRISKYEARGMSRADANDKVRQEDLDSGKKLLQTLKDGDRIVDNSGTQYEVEDKSRSGKKFLVQVPPSGRLNEASSLHDFDSNNAVSIAAESRKISPEEHQAEELPEPEKRPFQEPAKIVQGRQPLTREEREQERYDERVREVQEELKNEKSRRMAIPRKALDDAREAREQRMREGQGFNVVDRRGAPDAQAGSTANPVSSGATGTGLSAEDAPSKGLDPLPPPPAVDVRQLEHHEAVATWSLLEYEKRRATTTDPKELAELDNEIAENKQLLKDVQADKRTAQMLMGAKQPAMRKAGDQIASTEGSSGVLKTVTRDIPMSYKVVEGGDLKTSHDPHSFEPVAGYPEGVQERDYKNDKDAQVHVIKNGQAYDPSFTISDSPGPEHGPPVVTPDGIVLGGNSRAMSTMRHYGADGTAYRDTLEAKARQFGIDPAAIAGMKNPILVREVTDPPESIQDLRALGSDLNRGFTRKLSEFEQAVSAGKRISQDTLDFVGHQLSELGPDSTLRDLLRDKSGAIIERLTADGIIAQNERRAYIDEATGALNDTGKDFVERALLGAVVDDPLVLANAPRAALRKVERVLAPLARIKARGEVWDITDYLKEALREHIRANQKGVSVQDHLDPPSLSMFAREPVHPVTEAIARNLEESSKEVKKAYEDYAKDAELDVKNQSGLSFFKTPDPWDAFNQSFKANVRPEEWGTLAPVEEAAGLEPTPEPVPTETPKNPNALRREPKAPRVRGDTAKEAKRAEALRVQLQTHKERLADLDARGTDSVEDMYSPEELEDIPKEHWVDIAKEMIQGEVENIEEELKDMPPADLPAPKSGARADLRRSLAEAFKGIPEDHIDAAMALIDARAKVRGITSDEWIDERIKEAKAVKKGPAGSRAQVKFAEDGKAIIRAFTANNPNIRTLAHELGHIFRRDLGGSELDAATKWVGGDWNIGAEEKFAKAFENYLQKGAAPTPELDGVFGKFKDWLGSLFTALKSTLKAGLTPEITQVFDRMLGGGREIDPTPVSNETKTIEPPPEVAKAAPAEPKESSFGHFLATKEMSDDDLRTAKASLDAQVSKGLSKEARARIEAQAAPFQKELDRRGASADTKNIDRSVIFTKDKFTASIEALKKKKPTILNYTDDEEETIRDLSNGMGHLFENGFRDYDSNIGEMSRLVGDWVKTYGKQAFDRMLAQGRSIAQKKLDGMLPEEQRRKLSDQLGLFETHEKKNRRIELPPGVEVRREREVERTNQPREAANGRTGAQGREAIGQITPRPDQPLGRDALGAAPGRGGRTAGSDRPSGVNEVAAKPLRGIVAAPKIDVEFIPSTNPAVEPAEWKRRLADAGLADGIPPPTRGLRPEIDAKLLFKGQPEVVQTVLTSLDKYGAAVLATTTGTGKTYTGSAIFAEENPRLGLILTPSQNLNDNWVKVAEEFGVDVKPLPKDGIPKEPGVYIGTYATAGGKEGIEKAGWDLLLADESHKARRWYADTGTGVFLKKLAAGTKKVIYASATPFHSALELGYMDNLGLWKNQGFESWAGREFNTRRSEQSGKWNSPFNPRKLAALRQELINRGMFVNLDRDMRGYDVNFAIAPLGATEAEGIRNTVKAFRLAEEYFTQKKIPQMVMAVKGNAVTFMKSFLERARLPQAIELGKKLEKQGWKVAYFTENKTEVDELYDFLKPADQFFNGEISKLLPKLPSVTDVLKQAHGDDLANFTGAHSSARQKELDDFNSGEKKHIIATYAAGGLGVSMHDLSGDAPRAAVYLGPPWSGVMFDQAIGRPWRFGTKSNVNAYFLTSNAGPEMDLMFRKVVPRFESLKAAISGINKADPIVSKMKDLDALLDYESGGTNKVGVDDFMRTVNTGAIRTIKEAEVPSAENAKNKGMQVERRKMAEPPTTLNYKEPPIEDLGVPQSSAADAAKAVRRPYVPNGTEKNIDDPRLLDHLEQRNRDAMGIPGGDQMPPRPPDEILGDQHIPPPGRSNIEYDLANPQHTRAAYEAAKERYGKTGLDDRQIAAIGKFESGIRAHLANLHTAPYVLKQFEMTSELPKNLQKAEMHLRQKVASMRVDANQILGDFAKDKVADRRIFEALQRAHNPATELKGASSEWVDHKPFTPEELQVAQRLRDEIFEPIIDAVQKVRPDIGRRYRYAPLMRQIDEITSTLYPELNGKIPADLVQDFSLEVRQSLTKDPFSPHTLKRNATPPKALRISEAMDAYIPSMLRVAELTPEARKTAAFLAGMPDSALKDYAKRYARVFFGVPSEYKNMEKLTNNLSHAIVKMTYSAAMDLNPKWFVLHSMKIPLNIWPELGTKYSTLGLMHMTSPEGHELLARSGVLLDTMWQMKKPTSRFGKTFSNILHGGMIVSDRLDRGTAYLGGLEKAKDLGYFGPKEQVGKITWDRLSELTAQGIDVQKGLDFAYDVVARTNFMFTNANVQHFVRENPLLGQYKSFPIRQAEFFSNMRKLSKEAKAQSMEPEAFAAMKAARGEYEYIDAVPKYRRLVFSTVVAAIGALGLGSRMFPYYIPAILSPAILFANDTQKLIHKTMSGEATEHEWTSWLKTAIGTFVPGAGFLVGQEKESEKEEKKHKKFGLDPIPRPKYPKLDATP